MKEEKLSVNDVDLSVNTPVRVENIIGGSDLSQKKSDTQLRVGLSILYNEFGIKP